MSILEKVRKEFIRTCNERSVDLKGTISIRPLSSRAAIGDAEGDFVIKKGKEHVIEATFDEARGQAFTGTPCRWTGTLEELLSIELSYVGHRGIFVAVGCKNSSERKPLT